jgi:hypothetical protein
MDSFEYNNYVLSRLKDMLLKKKEYYIDLHIHSFYSADGSLSAKEIINRALENELDVISITDHDSIEAYNEIMNMDISELNTYPIIIPGIEFSVYFQAYGKRCHVIKYFFDQTCKAFKDNLAKNELAYRNRVKRQFELMEYNKTLTYYKNEKNICLSIEEYEKFLSHESKRIYEYTTLMKYINSELKSKGITVWDIYKKTLEYNEDDPCEQRKFRTKQALLNFYAKNVSKDIDHDYRKLSRVLAIVNIDDNDFDGYTPRGNLTVNEYGQVSIEELVNCGINIMAHPDKELVDFYPKYMKSVCGMEINYRSSEIQNEYCQKYCEKQAMIVTKGSDLHSETDNFYYDKEFYRVEENEIEKIIDVLNYSLK